MKGVEEKSPTPICEGGAPITIAIGIVVLLLDTLLIAAFVLQRLAGSVDPAGTWTTPFRPLTLWNRAGDGSFIELFGHLQLVLAAGLLFRLARQQKGYGALQAWAWILVILAADDFFTFHEQAGRAVASLLRGTVLSWTSAAELGGAVFWFVVALPLSAFLLRAYRRSVSEARYACRVLLWCALPLGIVVAGYIVLSVLTPEHLDGAVGLAVVAVRVVVKVLTTSVILLFTVWWSEIAIDGPPAHGDDSA